jgi:hypothetical protein
MSSAAIIARALGGHRSAEGYLCRCPVPSHGRGAGDRNPSLFVKDGDKAPLFKCFAGCDARDIVADLRGRGLCPQDGVEVSPPIEAKPFIPTHKPDPEALALWHAATPIEANTAQATYIRSRGLTGQPPPSLRATTILHLVEAPSAAASRRPGYRPKRQCNAYIPQMPYPIMPRYYRDHWREMALRITGSRELANASRGLPLIPTRRFLISAQPSDQLTFEWISVKTWVY